MATRVVRTCDIEGKKGPCDKAAEAVTFGQGSVQFEIDLCDGHRGDLQAALLPFMNVAHVVKGETSTKKAKAQPSINNAEVRAWLKEQGIDVAPQGRIPNKLIEQWRNAQGLQAAA